MWGQGVKGGQCCQGQSRMNSPAISEESYATSTKQRAWQANSTLHIPSIEGNCDSSANNRAAKLQLYPVRVGPCAVSRGVQNLELEPTGWGSSNYVHSLKM